VDAGDVDGNREKACEMRGANPMTKADMRQKATTPSLEPHAIHEFAWWYEDERGIEVVQESRRPDGTHIATETARISWRALLAAAKRCGALKELTP
jgi:hypothetical protein